MVVAFIVLAVGGVLWICLPPISTLKKKLSFFGTLALTQKSSRLFWRRDDGRYRISSPIITVDIRPNIVDYSKRRRVYWVYPVRDVCA